MPEPEIQSAELSPVKRALAEIRALRARIEELESRGDVGEREPIAIVGAGIRFPGGVVDESSFWDLLAQGKDAIGEIPRDRWDWRAYFSADANAPGTMITRQGGFLENVDQFDAGLFGIAPREAAAMDPQHRLALEVCWEALENAGHSAEELKGSATGVFLGLGNNDYGRAAMADVDNIDAYTASGNSPAMVAGRLSYVLGLHGPSLAIDTSCSSSLVAVHLACASLTAGECSVALAGGVNLILTPESNIALSKAHMMAPDGRCKTFDAAADGYVRSEGCCVVVLKKLSQAMADGDRVLAVIRGSAVNHDGRSGGLTAPNGPAQAAVMQQALAVAGVQANEIGYVETHGTGTSLGDPIEVETLAALMASGRAREAPLAIGSVKTNIGHTEAVSGIAGMMKTVLALMHREIPPSLHLKQKNPHIGWDRLAVSVPTELTEWKAMGGHRYAGVSSFGFSGTNAHVVLEEAPERRAATNDRERCLHLLTISARTPEALDRLRGKYIGALRACAPEDLANLCFTANAGRADFAHRLAVVGESGEEMALALERGVESPRVFAGCVEGDEEPLRQSRDEEMEPETLASLYVRGRKVDWKDFEKGSRRMRVAAPTYPFERQRYWLADGDAEGSRKIWQRSMEAARMQSTLAPIGLDVGSFAAKWDCLERLTIAEMLKTLRALGAFAEPNTWHDSASLVASCGITPAQTKLMGRWLPRLCEAGFLEREGSGFRNRLPLPEAHTEQAWREAEEALHDDPYLLEYLRNCSARLRGVLLGTISPLETLFPGESPELARNLYENSGGARYANWIVAAAVEAACAAAPMNRRLQIVELGAGTGATTAAILPRLPGDRVTYRFTDISEVFLQKASARFVEYPFVRYGLLDMESGEQMNGFAGLFDVVIAANAVHATRDLEATLQNIARLLAPGGTLVLLEATKDLAWRDITIGLIEGWQKPEDELRGHRTLVDVEEWSAALVHAGFEEVVAAPEAGSAAEAIGLHVILARASGDRKHVALGANYAKVEQHGWSAAAENLNAAVADVRTLLQDAPPAEHRAILLEMVREEIARVLGLPANAPVGRRDGLMDLGLDSLMAVELRNRLAARVGVESLPATLIFDYPTADAIAGYLLERVGKGEAAPVETSEPQPVLREKLLTAKEVADMPEEEIAVLLRSRLNR